MADTKTLLEIADRGAASTREFIKHVRERVTHYQEAGELAETDLHDRLLASLEQVLAFEEETATRLRAEMNN